MTAGEDYRLIALVLLPFLGAAVLAGIKKEKWQAYLTAVVTLLEFGLAAVLFAGGAGAFAGVSAAAAGEGAAALFPSFSWEGFCGMGLFLKLDGFRSLYALIAALMWLAAAAFSLEYFAHYENKKRYYFFLLLTLGATMGVFLSADLFTAFIFFEIMSFTSYVWVAQDESRASLRAAETYLAVAVIGGLVMLMGLFLLYSRTGTLMIGELRQAAQGVPSSYLYAAGGCILFGFGAKAGMFPLHIWLPKAHPVAPAPASALLSGILTKAGVFGILAISCDLFAGDGRWGGIVLLLGVLTMLTGALLALFSVDLKRVLACSSVSQIGFILVGVGMQGLSGWLERLTGEAGAGAVLAARGALMHMVNHSLFKLVLFLAAGVVFMNVHKLDLNEIRGFGHRKPMLHLAFLLGALGISGIPFFSGYVSKTLLHESITEFTALLAVQGMTAGAMVMKLVEWCFLLSGGVTLAYMLKLYVALFLESNEDKAVQDRYDAMKGRYMNRLSAAALVLPALVLPVLGLFPSGVSDRLMDLGQGFLGIGEKGLSVSYFSSENLQGALITAAIGVLLYFGLIRGFLMRPAQEKEGHTYDPVYNKLNDRVYVDRWPAKLDLEERIYRPLLCRILPETGTFFARLCDRLVDSLIVLLRHTVYRDSKLPHELEEGTPFTHAAGTLVDDGVKVLNHTVRRKHPIRKHYEHQFAIWNEFLAENNTIISRSLSFGLLLVLAGLLFTIFYVIF